MMKMMSSRAALLLLALAFASASGAAAPLSRIRVDRETQFFIDDDGRARFFHGVNAVEKLPPFHPALDGFDPVRSLSAVDAARLSGWGFNVVRLGVMWQAVVPDASGQVNARTPRQPLGCQRPTLLPCVSSCAVAAVGGITN